MWKFWPTKKGLNSVFRPKNTCFFSHASLTVKYFVFLTPAFVWFRERQWWGSLLEGDLAWFPWKVTYNLPQALCFTFTLMKRRFLPSSWGTYCVRWWRCANGKSLKWSMILNEDDPDIFERFRLLFLWLWGTFFLCTMIEQSLHNHWPFPKILPLTY